MTPRTRQQQPPPAGAEKAFAQAVVAMITPMFTRLEEKLDLLFSKIDILLAELAGARARLDEATARAEAAGSRPREDP
ncbi:MAG TPA: hypothetical protein VH478_26630 [Trebonia sp.]|jgi:hypothetical protein|nr:hypothetical protein [Trebonia sp.]